MKVKVYYEVDYKQDNGNGGKDQLKLQVKRVLLHFYDKAVCAMNQSDSENESRSPALN